MADQKISDEKFFERHIGTCDVCAHARVGVEVISMPGVPASFAYCRQCYTAGAHPYDMVVVNTAMVQGLSHAADWWKELVERTLAYLEVDRATFEEDVRETIKEMRQLETDGPREDPDDNWPFDDV